MPNWTYNVITIQGSKSDIDKLMSDAVKKEDGRLYLSSWFPVPESFLKYDTTNHPNGEGLRVGAKLWTGLQEANTGEIVTEELIEEYKRATQEQKEKYGAVGWYDYNCKYFGCKWNCEVEIEEQNDDEIILRSETPWCSPDVFLLRFSKRYPTLHIYNHAFYEEGYWEDYSYQCGKATFEDKGEEIWDEEELEIIR